MTITPDQARELTPKEKIKIRNLEKKIDEYIKENFERPNQRVVYNLPENNNRFNEKEDYVTRGVIKGLIQMYEEAGWNVKYNSDQREGSWLEFIQRKGGTI